MNQLVEGALQESGVYGHDGYEALSCQSGGEGDSVLFAYAHIEDPLGNFPGHGGQPGAIEHRRRNDHNFGILPCNAQHGLPGDIAIADPDALTVGAGYTMESDSILLCRLVSLTLDGDNMEEGRPPLIVPGMSKGCLKLGDIVSIDRTEIGEPQLLPHYHGKQETLDASLDSLAQPLPHGGAGDSFR